MIRSRVDYDGGRPTTAIVYCDICHDYMREGPYVKLSMVIRLIEFIVKHNFCKEIENGTKEDLG